MPVVRVGGRNQPGTLRLHSVLGRRWQGSETAGKHCCKKSRKSGKPVRGNS